MSLTIDDTYHDGRVADAEAPSARIRALEEQVAALEFAGKPERAAYVRGELEKARKDAEGYEEAQAAAAEVAEQIEVETEAEEARKAAEAEAAASADVETTEATAPAKAETTAKRPARRPARRRAPRGKA